VGETGLGLPWGKSYRKTGSWKEVQGFPDRSNENLCRRKKNAAQQKRRGFPRFGVLVGVPPGRG